MKNGNISETGKPLDGELALINEQTRRTLSEDEVFAFSVVLCDNEIDRDFERFSVDCLHELAKLYVGKTGIFDHSHKGSDQCARIFKTAVETVEGKINTLGEAYVRLTARAYMPICDKNKDLMLEIDAGIKREVSVGCSTKVSRCSICGATSPGSCGHKKGRTYRNMLCYSQIENPTDAYEWSFVAVPAQPAAGVIKAFKNTYKEESFMLDDIKKSLSKSEEVTLTVSQVKELKDYIDALENGADIMHQLLKEPQQAIIKHLTKDFSPAAA
ncbi:MAG: hypothetical protein RRZ42_08295, partial [Oscillospiraceae bacterium]